MKFSSSDWRLVSALVASLIGVFATLTQVESHDIEQGFHSQSGTNQPRVAERFLAELDEENLIVNPGFDWQQKTLTGWDVQIGASNGGSAPVSNIATDNDGTLVLSGDQNTLAWNFVSQSLTVVQGDYLLFSFSAKATDVRRQGNQYDNCWVSAQFLKEGQVLSRSIWPVTHTDYIGQEGLLKVPDGASEIKIALFLSKSGTLNIKDVRLVKVDQADSFDLLVNQMDRYYSYFDLKGIDWKRLTEKYRKRAEAATGRRGFEQAILPMLAELRDGHVWLESDGKVKSDYRKRWRPNFDFDVVDRDLIGVKKFPGLGLVAETKEGLGYVRIRSLTGNSAGMGRLVAAVRGLFDRPGIIIDLRQNGGGNEELGKMLASQFCQKPTIYARQKFRLNGDHDQFYEMTRSPIVPDKRGVYGKLVVCLIGPGAVSSAEGTAMMFAALPSVKLVGLPTRGSSGNPQPVELPNGAKVWFSRWVAMNAKGEPIEDRGVQPDVFVELDLERNKKGDPAWSKAVGLLKIKED